MLDGALSLKWGLQRHLRDKDGEAEAKLQNLGVLMWEG